MFKNLDYFLSLVIVLGAVSTLSAVPIQGETNVTDSYAVIATNLTYLNDFDRGNKVIEQIQSESKQLPKRDEKSQFIAPSDWSSHLSELRELWSKSERVRVVRAYKSESGVEYYVIINEFSEELLEKEPLLGFASQSIIRLRTDSKSGAQLLSFVNMFSGIGQLLFYEYVISLENPKWKVSSAYDYEIKIGDRDSPEIDEPVSLKFKSTVT